LATQKKDAVLDDADDNDVMIFCYQCDAFMIGGLHKVRLFNFETFIEFTQLNYSTSNGRNKTLRIIMICKVPMEEKKHHA